MEPIRFVQVLCATLNEDDWSHSGRSEGSRRTITSSILASGMHRLRNNVVYEDPDYITGRGEKKLEYSRNHVEFDLVFRDEHPEYANEQKNRNKS